MNFKEALHRAKSIVKERGDIVVLAKDIGTKVRYRITLDDTGKMTFQENHVLIGTEEDYGTLMTERILPFDSVKENADLISEFDEGWYLMFRGITIGNPRDSEDRNHHESEYPDSERSLRSCCGKRPSIRHELSEYTWGSGIKTPAIKYFVQCQVCGKKSEISLSIGWSCEKWND